MDKKPLVSIITPTFNRADFLPETIESVLSQDYDNFEFLIIDDGSTDNSKEVIEGYIDSGKIRYFYQENSGQSVARNKGIAEAKGEFICFLDSDNRWLPGKLSASIKAFESHPDVDIVYGDVVLIDEAGKEFSRNNMKRYSGQITKELLQDNCVSMNTTMTRTEKIREVDGFSEHVKVADDYDLWLRLSATCTYLYVPELMADYRVMTNQISSDKIRRFNSNEEMIKRFIKENPSLLSNEEQQDALNFFYTRAARHFSETKRFELANNYFKKALAQKAFSKRTWRALARHVLNLAGQSN